MNPAAGSDILTNLLIYVGGPLFGLLVTLAGFALKRKGAEQQAEDTVYGVTAKTIARLTAEVAERDAKINQFLEDISRLSSQRNEADAHASRATVAAEIAEDSAKRASHAADAARIEIEAVRASRLRDRAYINELRAILRAAGIAIPPEPEV